MCCRTELLLGSVQPTGSWEPQGTQILSIGCFLLAMAVTQGFMTALAARPALHVQAEQLVMAVRDSWRVLAQTVIISFK